MIDRWLRVGLYPLVAVVTALYLWHDLSGASQASRAPGAHHGVFIALMVAGLVAVESLRPLQRRWCMTWRLLLRRDLPFMLIGALTIGAGNALAAWVILHHGLTPPVTWLRDVPILPAALLSLLVTDGLWYAVHRYCHEGRSAFGRWCWRMHAAHHRPGQVYVLMHAVAHPLNTVIVRLLLTLPPWLMGIAPEALYVATVVTSVQGLVSHFNADSRAGWLNRLLIGTELHRWHHAAGVGGHCNYGAVLSVWDQLFGTFVFRPGDDPPDLGVEASQRLPRETDLVAVLLEPLRPGRS